ncbi:MAG: hypothetical protein R3244_06695 [Thermoanaerobaculia bacterium]|nr:hypothetical protein [Thermoanaerobaculia bacterium]
MRLARPSRAALLLAIALVARPSEAPAYETDQYTARRAEVADSTEVLNREVNRALEEIVAEWHYGRDERRLVRQVYRRLGGRHWVDAIERFAIRSPEVDQFDTVKAESIYAGVSPLSGRVVFCFGLGPTIRLAGTLIGSDKLGHFFSQGWKYYRRHRRGQPEERVVALGLRNETWIFGRVTTGVFSNADLVANYEGYLFYRGLFEDDVVSGRPAIVRFEGAGARLMRRFDWRDHVNPFWDEALNPSAYDRLLAPHVRRNLQRLCPLYRRQPERFELENRGALESRYAHLGLRDASRFRIDRLCRERDGESTTTENDPGDDLPRREATSTDGPP